MTARAENTDLLQNFRFQVTDLAAQGGSNLGTKEPRGDSYPAAGFNTCGLPKWVLEESTYREGIWTYTKKQAGIVSTEPITMTQGVAKKTSAFFEWVLRAIKGGEYRSTISIGHFHRDNEQVPARRYILHEAWPSEAALGDSLDASSSETTMASLTITFEKFDIEIVGGSKIQA